MAAENVKLVTRLSQSLLVPVYNSKRQSQFFKFFLQNQVFLKKNNFQFLAITPKVLEI